jgi:hypothetical protein
VDTLHLSVEDDDGYPIYPSLVRVVRIKVNGRDLLEAIREAELPSYQALGRPEDAGDYVRPPLLEVAPPSRYFYGEDGLHDGARPRAVSLCVCANCGDRGCWDWGVWIDCTEDTVTWSNIGNWREKAATKAALGPFTFERAAYDHEVGLLVDALEPLFLDRLARARAVAKDPYLVVTDPSPRWGCNVARRPWGLGVRFEQEDGKGGLAKRWFDLWAADTEDEVRRREVDAREYLGLSLQS